MSDELPVAETTTKSSSGSARLNDGGSSVATETTNASAMPLTSTSSSAKYEALKSLSDIRTTRDLDEEGVRDILRRFTSNYGLQVTEMGALEDMSGLNDAFNSSICSMEIKVRLPPQGESSSSSADGGEEKTFHFVIKSPPSSSFVKMMHKFSRPFFNEIMWYEDLVHLLELANGPGCIDHLLPKCYFAYSNYYEGESNPSCCEKRSCPWFCYVPCKPAEVGILILENIKFRERQYRMYDKSKPLDLPHVRLVMKELANFHGMWLRYKFMAQKGELEPKVQADGNEVSPVPWAVFEKRHNTQKRMPKMVYTQLKNVAKRTVLRILAKYGNDEAENVEKCRQFFNRTAKAKLDEYMQSEPTPVYTLCHGDFWSNNILFSYDDENNASSPRDLVIIDYQLINVG